MPGPCRRWLNVILSPPHPGSAFSPRGCKSRINYEVCKKLKHSVAVRNNLRRLRVTRQALTVLARKGDAESTA